MKRLIVMVLFMALPVMATTYTAATSAQSDVQTAVNLTSGSGGDTVQIPCSGTQSVIWTGTLTGSHNFTLTALGATPNTGTGTRGAGTNCLTILDNDASNPIMSFTPTYQAGQAIVVQNMNIDPLTAGTTLTSPLFFQGTCTGSGCPQMRIDNIIFGKSAQWTESGNGNNADWIIREDNMFGVLDHNTMPTGSQVDFVTGGLSAYLGVGGFGDNSWAQPDSFGGANALYFENNHLWITGNSEVTDCEKPVTVSDGGCRLVGRYNTIETDSGFNVGFSYHGLDTSGRERGGRQIEAYNNIVNCVNGACGPIAGFRAGTGYVFGNTLNANYLITGGFYGTIADSTVYRTVYTNNPFGPCGGLNSLDPWDTNDNTTYLTSTATSGTTGLVLTDASQTWTTNQWAPVGAPYSIFDVTFDAGGSFVGQIVSNTAHTITINGPISESAWYNGGNGSLTTGDTYKIIRATVCADQAGRGQGSYISGSSPSPSSALSQALDPIYEWDDAASNLNHGTYAANFGSEVIANRDYYTDDWANDNAGGGGSLSAPMAQTSSTIPFNGTTTCNASSGGGASSYVCGVGFGLAARRPTTCTAGVGYFATDTGVQGTLYKCGAGNSWASIYAPYTYPHPLEGGGVIVTPPPAPSAPSFAMITVH
jgi:hypothetical protein